MTNLLKVQDLCVSFAGPGKSRIRAVDGVSFELKRGGTLGLVGESGCGKSTTGYALLQLIKATSGRVLVDGTDVTGLNERSLRPYRRRMQIVFQDAAASLDPRMSIGDLIGEALDIHGLARGKERLPRVRRLLDLVGLPSHFLRRFPHELSGGQAQRVAICRTLAVEPSLIVCDEPVSALDVSIQAQIVNLMLDLQKELALSYVFISHDLSLVRHMSDQIAVMYLGRIVETADKSRIFEAPAHPYTRALLSAVPLPDPDRERMRERTILRGDLPSPADPPSGCRFRTRCPIAIEDCAKIEPPLKPLAPGHDVACIRV